MEINVKKTKVMVISNNGDEIIVRCNLTAHGIQLELASATYTSTVFGQNSNR